MGRRRLSDSSAPRRDDSLGEWLVHLSERASQLRDTANLLIMDINEMLERFEGKLPPDDVERLRSTRPVSLEELRPVLERESAERAEDWRNRGQDVEESSLHRVGRSRDPQDGSPAILSTPSNHAGGIAVALSDLRRPPSSPLVPRDFAMTARCEEDDLASLLEQTSEEEIMELVKGDSWRSVETKDDASEFAPIAPEECVMMINELRDGHPVLDHDSLDLDDPRVAAPGEIHTVHLGSNPLPAQEVIRGIGAPGQKEDAAPSPARAASPRPSQERSREPKPPAASVAPTSRKPADPKPKRQATRRGLGMNTWDIDSGQWQVDAERADAAQDPADERPYSQDLSPEGIEELLSGYLEDE